MKDGWPHGKASWEACLGTQTQVSSRWEAGVGATPREASNITWRQQKHHLSWPLLLSPSLAKKIWQFHIMSPKTDLHILIKNTPWDIYIHIFLPLLYPVIRPWTFRLFPDFGYWSQLQAQQCIYPFKIRKDETVSFGAKWTELEVIMLKKNRWGGKNNYRMVLLRCGLKEVNLPPSPKGNQLSWIY